MRSLLPLAAALLFASCEEAGGPGPEAIERPIMKTGKDLKGLIPELPGVTAPGWNICVADAAGKNRWVALTADGKSCKEPDWAPAEKPAGGR